MLFDRAIEEHQTAIAALRQLQQRDNDEAWKSELRSVRTALRKNLPEFARMKAVIERANEQRLEAHQRILKFMELSANHEAFRPAVGNFLPDDPEYVEWLHRHDELTRERKAVAASMPPEPNQMPLLQLRDEIIALQNRERHLLKLLDGRHAPESGIYAPLGGRVG